jgi:putative transposase
MSFAKIWIHAVWGTKYRSHILKEPVLNQVCAHIKINARQKGIYIDRINGYHDHIYVLMLLKPENSISKQMQLLKGESAYWANQAGIVKGGLEWSVKYFASSVSKDRLDIVRRYIDNQQNHHRKKTFVEEYRVFLDSVGFVGEDLD